jgi:hypothetical protein
MSRIRNFISSWTHGEDWRTWIAHAVIAVLLAIPFGWRVSIGYYFIRECEQILYNFVDFKPIKIVDHFMDVAVPAVVVLLISQLW